MTFRPSGSITNFEPYLALRGERLETGAPFGNRGTQMFIAGLTRDTLIAAWMIRGRDDQGAGWGPAMAVYIREALVPEHVPGTFVILDNLAKHRNAAAAKAIKQAGYWFLFLPPCSRDLNPNEQVISKLRAHLRKFGVGTFTDLFTALGDICLTGNRHADFI